MTQTAPCYLFQPPSEGELSVTSGILGRLRNKNDTAVSKYFHLNTFGHSTVPSSSPTMSHTSFSPRVWARSRRNFSTQTYHRDGERTSDFIHTNTCELYAPGGVCPLWGIARVLSALRSGRVGLGWASAWWRPPRGIARAWPALRCETTSFDIGHLVSLKFSFGGLNWDRTRIIRFTQRTFITNASFPRRVFFRKLRS